jgi:LemA protein
MEALIFGLLMAIALFWAVGAHNRLVRLRAEVVRQWGSVDAVWLRLLVRLQGGIAARQSLVTTPVGEGVAEGEGELQALQSACDELMEALLQARLQPLAVDGQKQVMALHQKVVLEIRALLQTDNEAVKPDLEIALSRMRQTLPAALIPYHVAVAAYNDALAMQPAAWLAKRLGLQPATKMDLSVSAS